MMTSTFTEKVTEEQNKNMILKLAFQSQRNKTQIKLTFSKKDLEDKKALSKNKHLNKSVGYSFFETMPQTNKYLF